jgi:hypothetical protein
MRAAYMRMFERMQLNFRVVQADTGAIGGSASEEFQVLAASGEDAIAVSDADDFAANVELAAALPPATPRPAPAAAAHSRAHARRAHHRRAQRAAACDRRTLPQDIDRGRQRRHAGRADRARRSRAQRPQGTAIAGRGLPCAWPARRGRRRLRLRARLHRAHRTRQVCASMPIMRRWPWPILSAGPMKRTCTGPAPTGAGMCPSPRRRPAQCRDR